jgi:Carboxypeptidase regulatory-like domain
VVASPSGQAISGSSVCVWPNEPNFEFGKQSFCTNTDRLGAFEIAVAPGAWLLAVCGGAGLRNITQETLVTAGKFVPVRLVLSPGGATLSGKVLDASGGPISKATIAAYPPGVGERPDEPALALALSGADGAFSLSATEGELELRVAADGYATALLSTSAPKTALDVALLPGSSVSGVVVVAAQAG